MLISMSANNAAGEISLFSFSSAPLGPVEVVKLNWLECKPNNGNSKHTYSCASSLGTARDDEQQADGCGRTDDIERSMCRGAVK